MPPSQLKVTDPRLYCRFLRVPTNTTGSFLCLRRHFVVDIQWISKNGMMPLILTCGIQQVGGKTEAMGMPVGPPTGT